MAVTAKHIHTSDAPADATAKSWTTLWHSEYIYAIQMVNAEALGYVELTKKQLRDAKTFIKNHGFANLNKTLLSNKTLTTSKLVGILSSNLPGSPMQAAQAASRLARKLQRIAASMKQLCGRDGYAHPVAYMVTLTVENVDLGNLAFTIKQFDTAEDGLRNSFTQKRGVLHNQLPAIGKRGSHAAYLGDLIATEITTNPDCMKNRRGKGLYHPHNHMIIIFDNPLSEAPVKLTQQEVPNMIETAVFMPAAAAMIFSYWAKLNRASKVSPQGFSLERAYVKNSDGARHDDMTAALAEAAKYPVKPDIYNNLTIHPTIFSSKVIAELRNATKGRKMVRAHGLMRDSVGYINWAEKSDLGTAILAASYPDESARTSVPDFFTKRCEQSQDGKLTGGADLSNDQLLYFNQATLAGAGFDSGLLEGISWPDSKRGKTYRYLTEHLLFSDRGKSGALNRADDWLDALETDRNDALAHGRKTGYVDAKMSDTRRIRSAMDTLLADDGSYTFHVSWSRRAKLLNALDTMSAYEKSGAVSWAGLLAHHYTPTPEETALVDLFGYKLFGLANDGKKWHKNKGKWERVGKGATLPDKWLKAFAAYKYLGRDFVADALWHADRETIEKLGWMTSISNFVNGKWRHRPTYKRDGGEWITQNEDVWLSLAMTILALTGCTEEALADKIAVDESDNFVDAAPDSFTDCVVTTRKPLQEIVNTLASKPRKKVI
ncbi:hypothetical protein [Lactiplantibacillus plantarum]|uniref:hypothetical protein n=1 Tax=Lactiplantibacillus plantarum TaxID=1590 RepID=UPI000C7F793A|nr:hypothetical protein [Lactiplantibacillus plantarum]